MNNLKRGISLVILGNTLHILGIFFESGVSNFQEFTDGLLQGLSVGINIVGIIFILLFIKEENK